jgi:uncharacterized RDD family membrane protein YckC/DNA-directed RNA polymerase subunit RPC12/RpoP
MPISFTCSKCGKEYRAKDEHAGMRARCTGCGAELLIPGAQAAPASIPPADQGGAGQYRKRFCPSCGRPNDEQATFCWACGASLLAIAPGPIAQKFGVAGGFAGYAGFWRRFLAAILDGLVLSIGGFVIGFAFGLLYALATGTGQGAEILGNILGILIGWLYYAGMESSSAQATLGKMAIGIRVTDLEGRRVSFGRATGRHFGKIISTLILLIGYIMAGFTARKQALHDMMAGCLVVKKPA